GGQDGPAGRLAARAAARPAYGGLGPGHVSLRRSAPRPGALPRLGTSAYLLIVPLADLKPAARGRLRGGHGGGLGVVPRVVSRVPRGRAEAVIDPDAAGQHGQDGTNATTPFHPY